MIKGEIEMRKIEDRVNEINNKLSLYEDAKFNALVELQKTIIISFTTIISIMIISFFIWALLPEEETTERIVDMNNSDGGYNNYIGENGEINNG